VQVDRPEKHLSGDATYRDLDRTNLRFSKLRPTPGRILGYIDESPTVPFPNALDPPVSLAATVARAAEHGEVADIAIRPEVCLRVHWPACVHPLFY
jgi:hypothetical protein